MRVAPVQEYILAKLRTARGNLVSTRTLAMDLYGISGRDEHRSIHASVCHLRQNNPGLVIRTVNRGRLGGGGYRLIEDAPPLKTTLGDQIRYHRTMADLSMNEMARRVDIDQGYLSRLESGSRVPSREIINRIVNVLHLTGAARDRLIVAAGYWPWTLRADAVDAVIAEGQRLAQEAAS